jgi:hypothetical protein
MSGSTDIADPSPINSTGTATDIEDGSQDGDSPVNISEPPSQIELEHSRSNGSSGSVKSVSTAHTSRRNGESQGPNARVKSLLPGGAIDTSVKHATEDNTPVSAIHAPQNAHGVFPVRNVILQNDETVMS